MRTTLEIFGSNVRAARKNHGWTQEELAGASKLAAVQISRIERGVREVRLGTLVRLLHALDAKPADLLKGL